MHAGAGTERHVTTRIANLDVVLRDGSTVCLRQAADQDVDALVAFLRSLSSESQYFRFLGVRRLYAPSVRALLSSRSGPATSLVAECGGRIVAFAGFYSTPESPDRAEVAFAVADALQGHGIGTRMLEQLARIARAQDIFTFDAYVMADELSHGAECSAIRALPVTTTLEDGLLHVVVSLLETERFTDVAAKRSRLAATASMKGFFEPRVVAVVGANRERGKIGVGDPAQPRRGRVHRARSCRCTRPRRVVQGCRAYPRVADIPVPVDLAVIVVPAGAGARRGRRLHRARTSGRSASSAPASASATPKGSAREAALRRAGARRRMPADRPELHGPAQHRSGGPR